MVEILQDILISRANEYEFEIEPKHKERLEEVLESVLNVLNNVANHFDIPAEDLVKKTRKAEIKLPRQICHYQNTEDNKRIFDGDEYYGLTGKLYCMNRANIIHNYELVNFQRGEKTPEGKTIREVLNLFNSSGLITKSNKYNPINLEKDEPLSRIELDLKDPLFLQKADHVCEVVAKYFGVPKEDFFGEEGEKKYNQKHDILFPKQICHYEISEENLKIFGHINWLLTAKYFGVKDGKIRHGHKNIASWKDLPTLEGKKIRELFALLKNGSTQS